MSSLNLSDFYYGSVLSMLINKGLNPILIENSDERRIYRIDINEGSFIIFLKYRKINKTKKKDYMSWNFNFTKEDIEKINEFKKDKNFKIALILVSDDIKNSELAILDVENIEELMKMNKTNFTITRKKRERAFRIILNRDRAHSLMIPTSRSLI
ncbi:MAG TPA: hypothetical protein DER56_00370 [Thermosipho africanus]|nr:hypothetical protein [Thermosipho africanus]